MLWNDDIECYTIMTTWKINSPSLFQGLVCLSHPTITKGKLSEGAATVMVSLLPLLSSGSVSLFKSAYSKVLTTVAIQLHR